MGLCLFGALNFWRNIPAKHTPETNFPVHTYIYIYICKLHNCIHIFYTLPVACNYTGLGAAWDMGYQVISIPERIKMVKCFDESLVDAYHCHLR